MIVIKIALRIKCIIKKVFFKALFRRKINFEKKVKFRKNFSIIIENEGFVKIGKNVFFNNDCSINSIKNIIIEDNCLFGESVKIYDHNHRFSNLEKNIIDQGYTFEKVHIEENCWIGSNVTILKGVHIGKGSVIGAGCVITKSIPPYSLVTIKDGITKRI